MGTGKTFLGKALAQKMQMSFFDIDAEIEKKTGLTIPQIFQKYGEKHFRKLESELLLTCPPNNIVATGGGIIEKTENRTFLQKQFVVWLNPRWEIIAPRITNSNRPLAKDKSEKELLYLHNQRKPFYEECADIIYCNNDADELMQKITTMKLFL
jgi:shikimate kinase